MKIDVTRNITDLDGNAVEGATLRKIACDALFLQLKGDEMMSGERKADFFDLAMRIHANNDPDLKAEEIALLKERIGKAFGPVVVGRAYEMLDPPALQAVAN